MCIRDSCWLLFFLIAPVRLLVVRLATTVTSHLTLTWRVTFSVRLCKILSDDPEYAGLDCWERAMLDCSRFYGIDMLHEEDRLDPTGSEVRALERALGALVTKNARLSRGTSFRNLRQHAQIRRVSRAGPSEDLVISCEALSNDDLLASEGEGSTTVDPQGGSDNGDHLSPRAQDQEGVATV
eukprot:TRINITY_DN7940_c0_g1_i1.p2 TRINITY_DN7940_c0_g1~~TRINITY_DN7940_c0_g1_i1.p2  ORF type:complete len:182 (+),score=28.80 TRINITY_DN7940_c0_g1_i1:184-729(+)